MNENMKARRPSGYVRRPRQYADGRVCAHPGCVTRLSTYNPRSTCRAHTPVRFPRVRGKVAPGASKA